MGDSMLDAEKLPVEAFAESDEKIKSAIDKSIQDALQKSISKMMLELKSEIVEELRSSEEKVLKLFADQQEISKTNSKDLQSIRTELKEMKQKLDADSTSEPIEANKLSTPGPIVPASSDEHATENAEYSIEGKCFVLKHVFKNVSDMKEGDERNSDYEEHFGVEWRMGIMRNLGSLSFDFACKGMLKTAKNLETWGVSTKHERKLLSINGRKQVKKGDCNFDADVLWGYNEFISWKEMEKNYVKDGKLTAEIHVKITNMSGVYKDNLRCFDEIMEEVSDVILVVKDQKFYVSKFSLAAHSEYFKALFLGRFQDSKKSEIKLTGIDADDFQNYLEVLYGEYAIDEITLEGIVLVADMYDTPIVVRKCEEFLLEKSKKTLKKKLEMSVRYNLEKLKTKCLSEIKTTSDIQSVFLAGNLQYMDLSLMALLLEKWMSF